VVAAAAIVCLDVHYHDAGATIGCVELAAWTDAHPLRERAIHGGTPPAAYVPGEFFRRELPYLLHALSQLGIPPIIVIDGHVWLGPDRKGLGAHLHDALGGASAVVGVAKSHFRGAPTIPVRRGRSTRPLEITAIGLPADQAAAAIASMHGRHRIPDMLRRTDRLARETQGVRRSRSRRRCSRSRAWRAASR
jgi:deoxyribonuclease V